VLPAVHALRVRYYAPYEALAHCYGLPPEAKPSWCYDIAETQQWLGYVLLRLLSNVLGRFPKGIQPNRGRRQRHGAARSLRSYHP